MLKVSLMLISRAVAGKPLLSRFYFVSLTRTFASDQGKGDQSATGTSPVAWRKGQLERLEQSLLYPKPPAIDHEADLQPEWKAMESRVTKRRSLTTEQLGGKSGRTNIGKSEEDVWLENGLYDKKNEPSK